MLVHRSNSACNKARATERREKERSSLSYYAARAKSLSDSYAPRVGDSECKSLNGK